MSKTSSIKTKSLNPLSKNSKAQINSKKNINPAQDKNQKDKNQDEKELEVFLSKGSPSSNPILAIEQLQWAIEKIEKFIADETESFGDRNNAQFELEGLKKAQELVGCALCLDVDEVVEAFHQKLFNPSGKSDWLEKQLEHALLYLGNKPLKKSSSTPKLNKK